MKTLFKSILVMLTIYSCTEKKSQNNNNITLSNYDNLEAPPSKPKYLNDKKKYVLPSVAGINVKDINPVFLELLKDKKILKTESLAENKYFIDGFAKNSYNLYYKGKFPISAGEYKNEADFKIYDFIYADDNQYRIACDNLKNELKKISIDNNYEYFDYFDIIGNCTFFLDQKNKKITVINPYNINGYNILRSFSKKNKNKFNETIFVSTTGIEIIK